MRTQKIIDYIQFSTPKMISKYCNLIEVTKSPMSFYTHCSRYEHNLRVLSGNPNTDKVLVIMSGQTCNALREVLQKMLTDEMKNGAKISRIDLCVTSDDGSLLQKFGEALENRLVQTKRFEVSSSKRITDRDNNVETMYVGSMKKRGKKGIFRAYNKGLEQGLGFDLSRFELEVKRDKAHTAARRYCKGTDIGNMIRAAIDLPTCDWWIDLMGNNEPLPKDMDKPDKKKTDAERRWAWLMSQVAKPLGEAIAQDELSKYEGENANEFMRKVHDSYNKFMSRNRH